MKIAIWQILALVGLITTILAIVTSRLLTWEFRICAIGLVAALAMTFGRPIFPRFSELPKIENSELRHRPHEFLLFEIPAFLLFAMSFTILFSYNPVIGLAISFTFLLIYYAVFLPRKHKKQFNP